MSQDLHLDWTRDWKPCPCKLSLHTLQISADAGRDTATPSRCPRPCDAITSLRKKYQMGPSAHAMIRRGPGVPSFITTWEHTTVHESFGAAKSHSPSAWQLMGMPVQTGAIHIGTEWRCA